MPRRPLALPALLLLPLAACGGASGGAGAEAGLRGSASVEAAAPATAPPVTAAVTVKAKAKATVKTAPPVTASRQFFTPSGNTTCSVSARGAVCEVKAHTWDLPPKPAGCEFDWDGTIEVKDGPATLLCASDTGFGVPAEPVLAYGASITMGDVRCTSARDGVTCENRATGHGFQVSRAAYRAY